jgi:glycerol-3-phosphate dehydrogenase
MIKHRSGRVGVLGAGLLGCCLALELAAKGYEIDLIDVADEPMTGASLNNEGKIHLGFVYASDPSKKTYKMMIQGALTFADILKRLTGHDPESFVISQPFHYYVSEETMMGLDAIHEHFQSIEDRVMTMMRDSDYRYLDQTYDRLFERNSDKVHQSLFSPDTTLGSFRTEERSVSPAAVSNIVARSVLAESRINFIPNTLVKCVHRLADGGVKVETWCRRKTMAVKYPCVVNCLWDGRWAVDRSAGVEDPGPWIMRFKGGINIYAPYALAHSIPSTTGIVGLFGDVVNYDNGKYYVSWYPKCKRVQCVDEDGRKLHNRSHRFVPRCIRGVVKHVPPAAAYA